MKPEAQGHVFCSALELVLCGKALALEKNEEQASIREDSEEAVSQSEEGKNVHMQPVFRIIKVSPVLYLKY